MNGIGSIAFSGIAATAGAASSGAAPAFRPDARFAANYGLLASPDVDLAGEIIEKLIASDSLIAIAHVIRADPNMIKSLLDIRV